MSPERRKILDLLASGKISVDEAEQLLEQFKLPANSVPKELTEPKESKTFPRYFRVEVNANAEDSEGKDKVYIRLPMALIRTGIKLSTMMPREAGDKLRDKGIDLEALSSLQSEELMQALSELTVDVDSADGDTVRIYCE